MAPPSLVRARWWGGQEFKVEESIYQFGPKKISVKNPAKKNLQSAGPVHADC